MKARIIGDLSLVLITLIIPLIRGGMAYACADINDQTRRGHSFCKVFNPGNQNSVDLTRAVPAVIDYLNDLITYIGDLKHDVDTAIQICTPFLKFVHGKMSDLNLPSFMRKPDLLSDLRCELVEVRTNALVSLQQRENIAPEEYVNEIQSASSIIDCIGDELRHNSFAVCSFVLSVGNKSDNINTLYVQFAASLSGDNVPSIKDVQDALCACLCFSGSFSEYIRVASAIANQKMNGGGDIDNKEKAANNDCTVRPILIDENLEKALGINGAMPPGNPFAIRQKERRELHGPQSSRAFIVIVILILAFVSVATAFLLLRNRLRVPKALTL